MPMVSVLVVRVAAPLAMGTGGPSCVVLSKKVTEPPGVGELAMEAVKVTSAPNRAGLRLLLSWIELGAFCTETDRVEELLLLNAGSPE